MSAIVEASAACQIRPRPGGFGAEIIDLDISAVSDHEFRRIEQVWFDHSFLIFRDLDMTAEQHIAFTRRLGPLHQMTPLSYCLPDHPEILVLTNELADGKPKGIRRAGMGWHTDGEDKAIPNAGGFLYAMRIPEEGGDTLFADMYAACRALPDPLRQRVEGRRARYSRIDMHKVLYPLEPDLTEPEKLARPDVNHPIIRTHPRSGRKALYIGRWARDIEGMPHEEGRALVQELLAFASQPQFVYRHKWRLHDAILWDNRCMLHCATPFDETRYIRYMQRTTLEGDVPF